MNPNEVKNHLERVESIGIDTNAPPLVKTVENEKEEEKNGALNLPNDTNTWTVAGENYCGFTREAREVLEKGGKKLNYIVFSAHPGARGEWSKKYNHYTIPLVFQGSKFIGGCSELKRYLQQK